MVDIQTTKAAMEDLKHDLMRRLAAIDGDLSTPLDADGEDRAIEVENDDVLVAMRGEGAQQILAINAALERLQDGTYGLCTNVTRRLVMNA